MKRVPAGSSRGGQFAGGGAKGVSPKTPGMARVSTPANGHGFRPRKKEPGAFIKNNRW